MTDIEMQREKAAALDFSKAVTADPSPDDFNQVALEAALNFTAGLEGLATHLGIVLSVLVEAFGQAQGLDRNTAYSKLRAQLAPDLPA